MVFSSVLESENQNKVTEINNIITSDQNLLGGFTVGSSKHLQGWLDERFVVDVAVLLGGLDVTVHEEALTCWWEIYQDHDIFAMTISNSN